MEWTLISATNNDRILRSCLLASPDLGSVSGVILQRGFAHAALAYNDAIERAETDLLIFVHQDVYLPPGWLDSLRLALLELEEKDPDWGVLGVWGSSPKDGPPGYVWWTGLREPDGQHFEGVREVRTLDEVVLIFRKSTQLRFDQGLQGYHLYGTDICLEAQKQGRRNYIFCGFCLHETSEYWFLPWVFWRNYLYLRKKWCSVLPVSTPCTEITFFAWPALKWNLARARQILLKGYKPLQREGDPVAHYQALLECGLDKGAVKGAANKTRSV